MTDQPQNGPTGHAGADSEPPGDDVPAALGPDVPTDVHAVGEPPAPAAPVGESPAVAPPPPPAIAVAMDSQDVGVPPAVAPLEPGDSPAVSVPPGAPAPSWPPEDEPSGATALAAERPEIAVGAAFAGGLVLALILKRLAR